MGAYSLAENTPNSPEFICPRTKVLDFNEKRLNCPSIFLVQMNSFRQIKFNSMDGLIFKMPFSPCTTSGVTKPQKSPPLQKLRGQSYKSYKEAFITAYFLIEGLTPTYGGLKAPTINFLHVNTPISEQKPTCFSRQKVCFKIFHGNLLCCTENVPCSCIQFHN